MVQTPSVRTLQLRSCSMLNMQCSSQYSTSHMVSLCEGPQKLGSLIISFGLAVDSRRSIAAFVFCMCTAMAQGTHGIPADHPW